jgi:hypothetical protein
MAPGVTTDERELRGSGIIGTSRFPEGPAPSSVMWTSICWPTSSVTLGAGISRNPVQVPTFITRPGRRTKAGNAHEPDWDHHGRTSEPAPACATPHEASKPAAAATNPATALHRSLVTLTDLRRRMLSARFPLNTEQSPGPGRSTVRARYVPDGAANQGEQRSLSDNLIPAPTWEQPGSGSGRDGLLSSRSQVRILLGALTGSPGQRPRRQYARSQK